MNNSILVLVYEYSERDFVHPRNVAYKQSGYDVTVLDFSRNEDCIVDGIRTICLHSFKKEKCQYRTLVLHAPNLRNHFIFLKRYGRLFEHFLFFFHGHEVLVISKVYAKPYEYVKKKVIAGAFQEIYDYFKLRIWKHYLPKVAYKSDYIFVSKWMQDEFFKWTRIKHSEIEGKCHIIYNCIGDEFEKGVYDINSQKEYDFITIRSNIDGSKYCIDLVNKIASQNKSLRFLLIGRGVYFKHFQKADNIIHIEKRITKSEIIDYLQKSRCALMPTRTDAQGVMMCEMASIGMPLITTDIPVCHEVFDGFKNVDYIPLDVENVEIENMLEELEKGEPYSKNESYFKKNTSCYEVQIIRSLY